MTELAEQIKENVYPVLNAEEIEYCKLKVHYEADPEVVNSKIEEAVASLRKMKIPGFRPGRAPDQAIKMRLRPQINQFVAREMATHAIDDIVFEKNVKPIGLPKFTNVSIKGNKFSCDIEMNRKPEFKVENFKFEVQKPEMQANEETLAEKSLYNLRLRVGEVLPYEEEDSVEIGDQITFSFSATIDGEAFDGSSVEGEMYQVGSDKWNGFDNYLLGMKASETRNFDFVFEDGPEDLAGKTAKFSVTVHMGTKRKPHPINEEFYKIMGVQNIEELMEKLKAISRASLKRSEQEFIRNQVATKLVEGTEFDVPKFLIDGEARNFAAQSGIMFDNLSDEEKNHFKAQAERNVRLTLILDTIRESEPDSVLNDGEAQNHLAQHLQSQGQDPVAIFNNKAAQPQIAMLIGAVKDEFTLQWVANQATFPEQTTETTTTETTESAGN